MGANRERSRVVLDALREFPHRLTVLAGRLASGNAAMETWLSRMHEAGRKPVFIVMIERMGDLVACSPIARQLKQRDPSTPIAWVCSSKYSDVFIGNPYVDVVFHEESLAGWLLSKRRLSDPLTVHELFLDGQRCCWTGIHLPGRKSGVSQQNYLDTDTNLLLSYARAAGLVEIQDIEPDLYLPGPRPRLPESFQDRPLMVVHFDSEDPDRRLSRDAAGRLVNRAAEKGWAIVELGLRPIASRVDERVYFPGTSLRMADHILLLKSASYFCGVDSAFLHCANAYRIPSTLLLGKFRHFTSYQTFSGSFFSSGQSILLRGNVAMAKTDPDLPASLVPNAPPRSPVRETRNACHA